MDRRRFPGVVGSAVTRLFDLTIARTGIDEATAERAGNPLQARSQPTAPSKAHYYPGHEPLWVKLVFRSDNHKLLGAWLVGRDPCAGKRADVLAVALSTGMTYRADRRSGPDLRATLCTGLGPHSAGRKQGDDFQLAREQNSG